MKEFTDQTATSTDPAYKTIDEIFKETVEETIEEIESHIPEAFSGS